MHLTTRNVNTAFWTLVNVFHTGEYGGDFDWRLHGFKAPIASRPSRNGNTLTIEEPVLITYTHPWERVLFNPSRDANPFFHLYESLWMLAGRNDVGPLKFYVKDIDQFSDDGKTFNGAYGYRWRRHLEYVHYPETGEITTSEDYTDQLDVIVNHLKADPTSRRAVLQMWNVEDDLLKIGNTKTYADFEDYNSQSSELTSKDVCCLAGEVKFRSPEGDTDIATLAQRFSSERGYKFPVYTIDTVTGDQRLSWMTSAWKTGVKRTWRVIFDDGSSVRMTANHVVFRKKKVYEGRRCVGIVVSECLVGDLEVGDSLLSEVPEHASARVSHGYRMFKRNVFKNTAHKNMRREHREYYKFAHGESVGADDIHHLNEVKHDNRLDNLERLSPSDHQRRHKIGSNNPHCLMSDADKAKRGRIHSAVMQSGGKSKTPPTIRRILNIRPPYRTTEQDEMLWEWVCSLSNHKIVAIEDGGTTEVYDFTVPGRHNAVLSNGVLVHNCNLSAMFLIRDGSLDMTVTNRSNDLILGSLGANAVHFSVLHEYMADRLGVQQGYYHQFSNNLHVYDWKWKPKEWLANDQEWYGLNVYHKTFTPFQLLLNGEDFDSQVKVLVQAFSGLDEFAKAKLPYSALTEPFLRDVAYPMLVAHWWYRAIKAGRFVNDGEVADALSNVKSSDWREAGFAWMKRRMG